MVPADHSSQFFSSVIRSSEQLVLTCWQFSGSGVGQDGCCPKSRGQDACAGDDFLVEIIDGDAALGRDGRKKGSINRSPHPEGHSRRTNHESAKRLNVIACQIKSTPAPTDCLLRTKIMKRWLAVKGRTLKPR